MPSGKVTYRQRDILLTRCSFIKIRNPNLEIRNKRKHPNPKIEIRNGACLGFCGFWSFGFVSDFELRVCCPARSLACLAPSRAGKRASTLILAFSQREKGTNQLPLFLSNPSQPSAPRNDNTGDRELRMEDRKLPSSILHFQSSAATNSCPPTSTRH